MTFIWYFVLTNHNSVQNRNLWKLLWKFQILEKYHRIYIKIKFSRCNCMKSFWKKVSMYFDCIYVYILYCASCLWNSKDGIRPPAAVVRSSCEPLYVCWELNLDFLEEKLVLSTTKPFLQPQRKAIIKTFILFTT